MFFQMKEFHTDILFHHVQQLHTNLINLSIMKDLKKYAKN